jgi:hypothetical protein
MVGKKWSLKIEKIEKVAQVPPVNQATPTSQPAPPAQDRVTQLMNTPGALLTLGKGDTSLFRRPLSGPETATLMKWQITSQDVINSIDSSLSKQGFNPKIIYTPEQIAAFRNRLDADLKQEYAPILSLFNGEYLNEK